MLLPREQDSATNVPVVQLYTVRGWGYCHPRKKNARYLLKVAMEGGEGQTGFSFLI